MFPFAASSISSQYEGAQLEMYVVTTVDLQPNNRIQLPRKKGYDVVRTYIVDLKEAALGYVVIRYKRKAGLLTC